MTLQEFDPPIEVRHSQILGALFEVAKSNHKIVQPLNDAAEALRSLPDSLAHERCADVRILEQRVVRVERDTEKISGDMQALRDDLAKISANTATLVSKLGMWQSGLMLGGSLAVTILTSTLVMWLQRFFK